jgi:glycosyltransferase involved in cell wall biosynthesis
MSSPSAPTTSSARLLDWIGSSEVSVKDRFRTVSSSGPQDSALSDRTGFGAEEERADGRLRVVFLNSVSEWGGGEKWCIQTATALARRGHYAAVACRRDSPLEARAQEERVPVWAVRGGIFGWGPVAVLDFAQFLRMRRIEAVVGNVGRDLRMGAGACRIAGAKLLQRRGLLRPIKNTRYNRWLYRHHVRRVIVNAVAIRERMLEGVDFADPRHFVHIPNAIDTERAPVGDGQRFRARLGLDPNALLVAAVGRLSAMKGHKILLQAWPAVRRSIPDAQLVLVGEGEERASLEATVAELGVGDSVRFLGFVRELGDVYDAMDILVHPSLRDEGCSNTVLEAMWQGRPCIVTACGGLPELVEHGETGRIVPLGDPQSLTDALIRLLPDTSTRERMGQEARKTVENRYSLDRVTTLFEHLIRSLRTP